MSDSKELYYALGEDEFALASLSDCLQKAIEKYEKLANEKEVNMKKLRAAVTFLIKNSADEWGPNEFAQAMIILLLAIEKRDNSRYTWLACSKVAYSQKDLEICREFVIKAIEESGKSDVKNTNKEFIPLSQEDETENVADILGMVIDELTKKESLDEEKYEELLEDFAIPLEKWNDLEVPKTHEEESYGLVHEIVELCYKHKAYGTALRLSGLLYVSDKTKKMEHLADTMYLMGKVMFELGYMEVAKRCFLFADEDTDGQCWDEEDDKYKVVMQQETKLEITEEILEMQRQIDKKIESGEIKTYTDEELDKYFDGELEIEFIDSKKQEKARKKLGEKAIKIYEKYAQESLEERMQGIEEAFEVFTEAPEVYEEAAYLYYLKANIIMEQGDNEGAYEAFRKAYNCQNGSRNGLVLLGIAITLSQMGRMNEATAYLFRTYIFWGDEFIIEKVGVAAWEMLESYLE